MSTASNPTITHVFVLMLENRSFDHMLGASGLNGIDTPPAGASNTYKGKIYPVGTNAPEVMAVDPGHEFPDVVTQLAGAGASYPPGGQYPQLNMSGFVTSYAGHAPANDYGEIMQAFTADRLPVLTTLAATFAVCDRWFASVPGPTWPNRFFAVAASSGGLDHSPTTAEMLTWEIFTGFSFPRGTIFDALGKARWRIYMDGLFTVAGGLKGISPLDLYAFSGFRRDVARSDYPRGFTFIEPSYGDTLDRSYKDGTSQHPLDTVTGGERLIKATYEAIRNSPHWNTSLLIITYDEHGGFYDHVPPGAAAAPDDGSPATHNQYGFTFQQYGVRVPAVVISPLIPAQTVDHTIHDHSSIPATIEQIFGLAPLTARDAAAQSVLPLLSLGAPRTDAPITLPDPVMGALAAAAPAVAPAADGPVTGGNLPGFLHSAMVQHAQLALAGEHARIRSRVASIRTRGEAAQYLVEVGHKLGDLRAGKLS
jgi:phospholipase C